MILRPRSLHYLAILLLAAGSLSAQDGRDIGVFRRDEPVSKARRVAICIGIDQYEQLSQLGYAERDAMDVATQLSSLGFLVTRMRMSADAGEARPYSSGAILAQLKKALRVCEPEGVVLFYFSGHGFEVANGTTYLCPYGLDLDQVENTGLALNEVRQQLEASGCKRRLMVVDMCRNDPAKSIEDRAWTLRQFEQAQGTGLLFSTAPGMRSFEPTPGLRDETGALIENGLFTHYFLRGLRGDSDRGRQARRDGLVTFREVAYFVADGLALLGMQQASLEQRPYLRWDGTAEDVLLRILPEPVDEVPRPTAASANGPDRTSAVGSAAPPGKPLPLPKGFVAATDAMLVEGRWSGLVHERSGIRLRYVPPGEFTMGMQPNDPGFRDNARPHRRIVRHGFYLGETEVTVGQWRRFVAETAFLSDAERGVRHEESYAGGQTLTADASAIEWVAEASWRKPFPHQPKIAIEDDHPVVLVSWNDAAAFCRHYGLTLPTEVQWEWASRARATTRYAWGSDETGIAVHGNIRDPALQRVFARWSLQSKEDDGAPFLAKVRSYRANQFGLYDMVGNVGEWCADGYVADRSAAGDGEDVSPPSPVRVNRPSCWYADPRFSNPGYRYGELQQTREVGTGFRVAFQLDLPNELATVPNQDPDDWKVLKGCGLILGLGVVLLVGIGWLRSGLRAAATLMKDPKSPAPPPLPPQPPKKLLGHEDLDLGIVQWDRRRAEPAPPPEVDARLPWAEVDQLLPDPAWIPDPEVRRRIEDIGLPWRVRDRLSGIPMLLVPPGEFIMGSPESEAGHDVSETAHRRKIRKPFYLGVCEVTRGQWRAVMGGDSVGDDELPVIKVSWDDVQSFLQRSGLSLPSEAQWEYACRAGTNTPFSFGDTLPVNRVVFASSKDATGLGAMAASSGRNGFGFVDMHGNVAEWCADTFGTYPNSGDESPFVKKGRSRVVRGGSGFDVAAECRSAFRGAAEPHLRSPLIGFRVAHSAP
jgi:sulfatase modifying factor 1